MEVAIGDNVGRKFSAPCAIEAGERDHDGVVGGERGRGYAKLDVRIVTLHFLREDAADVRVRRDAAADDERLRAGRV